jgi:putative nucleotidyltransferase with HDIG domain
MIKIIKVSDLRPRMYVHDLNSSWMNHPFVTHRFMLESKRAIEKIIECGITHVYIDTSKGVDVDNTPGEEVDQVLDNKTLDISVSLPPRSEPNFVPIEEELIQAKRIYKEASAIVHSTMQDCRLGKQVELEKLEPVVSAVAESIFRNPDAIVSLARIKQADTYTFQHSVAVGILLIGFCRSQQDQSSVEQVGIGGFLHDIGKMKVPEQILNKPGKLDEREFGVMKQHVQFGCEIVEKIAGISPISFSIVAEHHERYDGSGYPHGLKGNEISRYGQMASIVDVYDAMTSTRVYHASIEPTEVIKKLLEWRGQQFNSQLVQHFIRTIGIYPIGSLVKLESGYLAVVVDQHHENLLYPRVRVIFNIRTRSYILPKDFDLSKPNSSYRIVSFENPAHWGINPVHYLRL